MDEGGRAHARLSASGAKRWINCPGSVRASEGIPSKSSRAAMEGTAAHHLVERCLRNNDDARLWLGWFITQDGLFLDEEAAVAHPEPDTVFQVDDEMCDAVQVMLDVVAAERERLGPDARMKLEHRFDLSWLRPDMFGTSDVNIVLDFEELVVVDYKHGKGVRVEVGGNPQLRYYALGSARDEGWDFERVKMVIVQPRCPHEDGPVRTETISVDELRAFGEELAEAADATRAPNAEFRAGEWCGFCPAAATCPALREHALEAAALDFSAVGTPETADPGCYDADELAEALRAVPVVEAWCKAVSREALFRLQSGAAVPGKKLVRKKSTRRWVDGADVQRIPRELGLPLDAVLSAPKLLSPAQVEKVKVSTAEQRKLLKALVAELSHKPPGGVAVADEDDPREAISAADAAAADFED